MAASEFFNTVDVKGNLVAAKTMVDASGNIIINPNTGVFDDRSYPLESFPRSHGVLPLPGGQRISADYGTGKHGESCGTCI